MKHRIVVLGAGYSGAHAAGRLARRLHPGDTEITLVNAEPDFVERVRMHQLAAGQDLRPRPLSDVVSGTGISLRTARVESVDVERQCVEVTDSAGSSVLDYDTLVYALGSTSTDHGVPGVAEHAHHVASRDAAHRVRTRLDELPAGSRVLVVGAGLTGIEAATEFAEAHPDLAVGLVARGRVGDWLSEKAQRHLGHVLERLGITVHEHTDVVRVDEHGVTTGTGHLVADLTVWTAGFGTHPIAAATTLTVGDGGRVVVDASMRSVSHPAVYAVGDAALATGAGDKPLRMSCASGIPMGWRAADAIAARLTGRSVPLGDLGYTLQCISLGRRDGIIQPVTYDDRARSTAVTGRFAARIKEFVCAGAGWSVAHPTILLPSRRRRVTALAQTGGVTATR